MNSLTEKIEYIKEKNGIRSFGVSPEDLAIFSCSELKELCCLGLISNEILYKSILLEDFKKLKKELFS